MSELDERAHSKLPASGSVRWLNCAASVALEEKSPPSPDTPWSLEGTLAHECHEAELLRLPWPKSFDVTDEMRRHVMKSVNKVRALHRVVGGTLLVLKRVFGKFIHPEMFGTCDVVIAGADRELYILDFKYGAGHIVDAKDNTQLIQYALSVAESYDWDFDFVQMYILQPRAGENWYKSWRITMTELRTKWLELFKKGVKRVELNKSKPMPGAHCHWCRAKRICPAKQEKRAQEVLDMFSNEGGPNGQKEKSEKESGGESQTKKVKTKRFKDEAESFGFEDFSTGDDIEATDRSFI